MKALVVNFGAEISIRLTILIAAAKQRPTVS